MHKIFTKTVFVGKKVLFLPSCHSTNAIASQLVNNHDTTNGQVVITDYQTEGRGQRGNSWESEPGENILISVLFDVSFLDATESFQLTIMASLAISDSLNEYLPTKTKIKWPNDIYVDNRKISGMLIENNIVSGTIESTIVGLGINVNQSHFAEKKATSLKLECKQKINKNEFLELCILNLEKRYFQLRKSGIRDMKKEYISRFYWVDEIHVFKSDGEYFNGKILDVDNSGKLRLELEEGQRVFDYKEIEFVK